MSLTRVTNRVLDTGAVTGAAGGGKIAASAITGQTELTDALASGDEFLVHDLSTAALRRVAFNAMQPVGSVIKTDYVELGGPQSYAGNTLDINQVPVITSGHEILTKSFSTSNSANYVILSISTQVASQAGFWGGIAVFAGNTLIASRGSQAIYDNHMNILVKYSPPSTAAITYSLRGFADSVGIHVNRVYFYSIYDNNKSITSMLIQEIKG